MDIGAEISSKEVKKVWQQFAGKLPYFWNKTYRIVFVIFFLLCMAYAAYIWKTNISNPVAWSQEKKNQFLQEQQSGVAFKQTDFEQALKNISDRQAAFTADYQPIKDLFIPYQ
jgi:cell division protein FtsI/penicillin-binding protein 2